MPHLSAHVSSDDSTPLWLALVDDRSQAAATSCGARAAQCLDAETTLGPILLSRLSARSIFSGWLCTCSVRPVTSLGQPPELGTWVPRWVTLTQDALWLRAVTSAVSASDAVPVATVETPGGSVSPITALAGGAMSVPLRNHVHLPIRSVFVEREGLCGGGGAFVGVSRAGGSALPHHHKNHNNKTVDSNTAASAATAAAASDGGFHATDFLVWSPGGSWVFRAASPAEATAWLLHVHAATVRARSGETTMGRGDAVSAHPLLFGDAALTQVAEAVCATAARASTAALLAGAAGGMGEAAVCAAILAQYSARQQLRAFCRRLLPEHIALLSAYEHVYAVKILWLQYEKGALAVGGAALSAHALATFRRYFSANSRAPVQLPVLIDAALAAAIQAAGNDAPAASAAALLLALPTLLVLIRERVLVPFARARASRFTAYAGTEVRAQRLSAAPVSVRPAAKSFFSSSRRLSMSSRSDSVSGRGNKVPGMSISDGGAEASVLPPSIKSPSLPRRFTIFPSSATKTATAAAAVEIGGGEESRDCRLESNFGAAEDNFFDAADGEDGPVAKDPSAVPLLIGRIDASNIPSTAVGAPLDPLLFEPAGAQTYPNHDVEAVAALLPALLVAGEQGRLAWAVARRTLSLSVRLPTLAACDPAEFARAMRDVGVTPNKLRLVIKSDKAYTPDLWNDAIGGEQAALRGAVRDAVTSGILLTAEMRTAGGAAVAAITIATGKATTTTQPLEPTPGGLSEASYKSVFGRPQRRAEPLPLRGAVPREEEIDSDVAWALNAEALRLTPSHPVYDMLSLPNSAASSGAFEGVFACPAEALAAHARAPHEMSVLPRASLSLSLSLLRGAVNCDTSGFDSAAALYPVPGVLCVSAYAYWSPGIGGGDGGALPASTHLGTIMPRWSHVTLSPVGRGSPVVVKSDFGIDLPTAVWSQVEIVVHADGAVSLNSFSSSKSGIIARTSDAITATTKTTTTMTPTSSLPSLLTPDNASASALLAATWSAFIGRGSPGRKALFHASAALAILPTRFPWAMRSAIDIVLPSPSGVLTLFSAGADGVRLLAALNNAAARPVKTSVHALAIPAAVTGSERCRLQISSDIGPRVAGPSAATIVPTALLLSGPLYKRGAIRAAFRERYFKLESREETAGGWLPTLLRASHAHIDTAAAPRVIVLSYAKAGKVKGEVVVRSAGGDGRVLSIKLEKSPTDEETGAASALAPSSALSRALWGEGSGTGDWVWKVTTETRTWTFSTHSREAASLWIAVMTVGLRSRGATFASYLPSTRTGMPFATATGLPDASHAVEWKA